MACVRKHGSNWQLDMRLHGKRYRRIFPTRKQAIMALRVWTDAAERERKEAADGRQNP